MTVASKRVANTESPQPAKKVAISPIDGAEQSPIPVLKPAEKSHFCDKTPLLPKESISAIGALAYDSVYVMESAFNSLLTQDPSPILDR